MKRISIAFLIVVVGLVFSGCGKQEMTFVSTPVGYSLVDDTYVAKASFEYYSEKPYNIDKMLIELYYLPSIWGEIEIGDEQGLSEDNPYFLIFDFGTPNQRVFAKYIQIGSTYWTGVVDNDEVKYVNEDEVDIKVFLIDEQEAKWYFDIAVNNDAHFLDDDRTWLSDYYSILDTLSVGTIFQKVSMDEVINTDWSETLSSFPDLSEYYPDFGSSELQSLFQRVFAKAKDDEFITMKFYK
ncbi:MAG: hypothetical protein WCT17_01155 [Bacilli bacterium]